MKTYKTLAVSPELYAIITTRAKTNLRPINRQLEYDILTLQKLDKL